MLKRWQSMLNMFVLSRKYQQQAAHMQLMKSEFLYLPRSKGELQVMFIEAHLKKQRMLLLQQYPDFSTAQPSGHWTLPGNEIFKHVLPAFGPKQALDVLNISPRRHCKLVNWSICSPWWKETFIWFHEIRWDITIHSLPMEDQFAKVFGCTDMVSQRPDISL